MPGGDRTGPYGAGPMTGWGRGMCARGGGLSFHDRPWRWGGGAGFGGGRGWRHRFWATGRPGWQHAGWWPGQAASGGWLTETPESELQILEREAAALESELERVRARLDELSQRADDSK